ncbi:MAG: TetR/AcrR family transcriptional regulator [Ktedonobacterales bacterium]
MATSKTHTRNATAKRQSSDAADAVSVTGGQDDDFLQANDAQDAHPNGMVVAQNRQNRQNGQNSRIGDTADTADTADTVETPADLALREVTETLLPALAEAPRSPRQARSREKRAALLKAAEALFVERGYAGATADEIAAAAGVSVGTFYNHFRNKRQILLTLALERLEDIFTHLCVACMDLASGNQHDHHEALHAAVTSIVAGGRRAGLRHVWQELMSVEPELAPYQQVIRRYALARLEQQLRLARDQGKTWPHLDLEGTALAIFTLLDALSAHHDEAIGDDRIIASVTTLIERALFPPVADMAAPGATGARS